MGGRRRGRCDRCDRGRWRLHRRVGAATELANAEGQTAALLQQQTQYTDVRKAESSTSLLEAGQKVGGATEIAWGPYLTAVRTSLPEGVVINGVSVDSASAIAPYAQPPRRCRASVSGR